MAHEGLAVFGSILFVFGFLGFIVPIGEYGSVTDVDNFCNTAFFLKATETCQMASSLSKVAYSMMGIGVILAIIGAVLPSKKHSMFLCGICDVAFSSEAELYNHSKTQEHLEKTSRLSKEEIAKRETKEKITKRDLRKSPILKGVLIGIVAVVIFWGIFSITSSQVFVMSNNALSPDVTEGQLMYYERISFEKIREGDIIAFVPSDNAEFGTKVGIVRDVPQNVDYVYTSSNANPNNFDSVDENEFIGKITSVTSDIGLRQLYSYPYYLLLTGFLLISPIVILKIKSRK